MSASTGERTLSHLFKPGRLGRYRAPNLIKYGACCVSNYNTRDGFITPRELARTRVIAGTGCGIITNQGAYPDPKGEGSTLEVEYTVVEGTGRFAGYGGTFRSRGRVKPIEGESASGKRSVGVVRFEGKICRKQRSHCNHDTDH